MFERRQCGWLLGRPSLGDGVVGWAGFAILPDFSVSINVATDLDALFRERDLGEISALGCTSSENLIAALKPDIALRVAPKIVDLALAMRIASMGDGQERYPRRTIDLLAECVSAGSKGSVPESLGAALLEGHINDSVGFQKIDAILRSLLYYLAQRLRKAGELRRYLCFEIPAHRVLLAQTRFRLLADTERLAAVANELSSTLRSARVELVTKHSLDPRDLLTSFEARKLFAKRHLGMPSDRLTFSEFRDLLDSSERPVRNDQVIALVASYLKQEVALRSVRSLLVTDGVGCQVMYDSIGTSTGRVVMKSPGVQWLEKAYRKYILPPEGYEFRYIDYACFEPTILAAVSGDAELLDACNFGVYERVGEWLGLGGAMSRELAKTVLLRFIYGQSRDKLVATLSAEAQLEPEDARARLGDLERRLSRAFDFRSELEERARLSGYMETRVGNRCRVGEGYTFKALSHYLQGTGSLIFKRALADIFDTASVARLVVPMHDAFLCAFPTESLESCLQQAVAAMRAAFLSVVGVDLARVSVRGEF